MIGAGEVRNINLDNARRDGQVTEQEFNDAVNAANIQSGDQVSVDGVRYDSATWELVKENVKNILTATPAANQSPTDDLISKTRTTLAEVFRKVLTAEQELRRAQGGSDTAVTRQAEQKFNALKELLQTAIRQLEFLNRSAGKNVSEGIDRAIYTMASISPEGEGAGRASLAMTSQQGAAQANPQAGKAITIGGAPGGFAPPAGWGAQTAFPQFSTDAYMQSLMTEDNVLSSFDSVLKNQNQGKKLMMLFFYFAKMAESGDLGAMYQFMKFLTYIISKDKAKQQIDMGKKLIELQDLSRKWTDKLLGTQTNVQDPNSSNEFMKTMTQVKSETDAIATSQKLISQMMEEFSQIVETLTNTTKAALEANGRVLRTVSSVR